MEPAAGHDPQARVRTIQGLLPSRHPTVWFAATVVVVATCLLLHSGQRAFVSIEPLRPLAAPSAAADTGGAGPCYEKQSNVFIDGTLVPAVGVVCRTPPLAPHAQAELRSSAVADMDARPLATSVVRKAAHSGRPPSKVARHRASRDQATLFRAAWEGRSTAFADRAERFGP